MADLKTELPDFNNRVGKKNSHTYIFFDNLIHFHFCGRKVTDFNF